MRKYAVTGIALLALLALLASCSDESDSINEPALTQQEANTAFAALNTALAGGAATAVDQTPGPGNTLSYSYDCPQGGNAQFSGDWSDYSSFSFAVIFTSCGVDDIVLSGDAEFSASVTTIGTTSKFTYTYTGSLDFEGNVSGQCNIDVAGAAEVRGTKPSIQLTGSVCGHTVNAQI